MRRWMRRAAALLLALAALCAAGGAETLYDAVRLSFEEGFSLSVPADWVSFAVPEALAQQGYRYCLGSEDGARLMYVQLWPSDCADMEALRAQLAAREEIVLREGSGEETAFLLYNFADADASGCAALLNGEVLNLVFVPQSDADNMLIAATVMESYAPEDEEARGAQAAPEADDLT